MHELSICVSLIEQVERVARENGAGSVERILVTIGPLSGIEPELLRNAYPLAAVGTIAETAELEIELAEIVVHCSECNAETTAIANRLVCGRCGDYRTRLVSGDEMVLKRVELSDVSDKVSTH